MLIHYGPCDGDSSESCDGDSNESWAMSFHFAISGNGAWIDSRYLHVPSMFRNAAQSEANVDLRKDA